MRTQAVQTEIRRLLLQVPFQPFVLNLENGDRIVIEHSENLAFHPSENGSGGSRDFYVLSSNLRFYGTFEAVTSVALADRGE